MASKYNDPTSVIQVIGCVYNNPDLLSFTDKYLVTDEDFIDDFHKVVFGAIYKIYDLGSKEITIDTITDFLATRPKSKAIFDTNDGEKWLLKASDVANNMSFEYYYSRLKKMTLLRAYDNIGVDVSDIYDVDNLFDTKKKEFQEEWLDNSTLEDIANKINDKIEIIKSKYVDNNSTQSAQAGEGVYDLIEKFKKIPEAGVPLYGNYINTTTRGARLGKFYLRSAATGLGKTRSMIADACYIACNKIYDESFGWIRNGNCEPTLFIATEQDLSEVQSMMLAFLSNVNEEHILYGRYDGDEEDRVREAARILTNSPLYVEVVPDFSLQDIENLIKKNIRDNDVKYVLYDYIHSSMKILEEVTKRSGGVKLREDNILFMLSTKLKEICVQYGVFILSSTQLNGLYMESDTPDQNLLRGGLLTRPNISYPIY